MRFAGLTRDSVIPRRTEPGHGGPVVRSTEAPVGRAAGRTAGKVPGMRQLPVACLALAAAATLAACTGSSSGPESPTSGAPTSSSGAPIPHSTIATRWWSNDAASDGSTIDPSDPTAAAGSLKPNRDEYCSMLKQTVDAGKSILPGATANDPRLLASTEAFVAELQAVAPPEVSKQWKTLGDVLVQFVQSGGTSSGSTSTATLTAAATAISNDAKTRCGVDISSSGG